MQRWTIMIGCLLLWQADGMAQGKKRMPTEMAKKATALDTRVEALYQKGEYDAAFALARESLEMRERYLRSDHPDVAESLNNLALLHDAKGDYERAQPLYERALAIRETALGPAHPDVAESLNNLAGLHKTKGDYERAQPLYERALAIEEKALDPAHPTIATSLNNLAELHHLKGDYKRALMLVERALAIREKVLGPAHPDVATSLNDLGALYQARGDYERAEPLYERALAIREKALGPVHPDVAQSLKNLAGLYHFKGDYERALPLLERVFAIEEKTLDPDHPDVAQSLNNLAALHHAKGNYERAEPLYERALAIQEKVLGRTHPAVAATLDNLALLHQAKGDYERAEPLFERTLAIKEKALGSTHPNVAQSLNNLALLHQAKGEYEQALSLHQRALAIWEKALGPTHPDVAQSLNNLAVLHHYKGEYEQALRHYQRAFDIVEKALGPVHPDVAQSLNNLALLHYYMGDSAQAQLLLERALAIKEKVLGPAHPNVTQSLNNLAALHWAQGNMAEAIHYYRRAEDAREVHLALTIMADSERAKRIFLATLANDIDVTITLALQTGDADAMHLAATRILRRKGRVLHSMTATFAAVRRHPDASIRALWDEYRSNRTQHATQLMRGPAKIPPEQHRKNLDTLQARAAKLERLLGDKSRAFRDEQTPVTVEAVQATLPRDAALVEWMRYRPRDPKSPREVKPLRYAACVLHAAGRLRCLDLGDATAIDADIMEMRNALARNLAMVPHIARRLEARIMAPVRAQLSDIRRVYLSPDGPLHLIPFAALRDEHGRYLVERYTFTYLTTGRDLLHRTSTEHASSHVVITTNPARGEPRPGEREAFSFAPLPDARQEAATVAAMFREPLMLQGADASEARVKQIHSPLIWHHAGHASYKPVTCVPGVKASDDPRLQSVLPMAGGNVCRDGDDDGLLTAVEVAGLDLGGTKLVVLSACESGMGATSLGDTAGRVADGVYGLRRALVIAGSETQVMSLWQVGDHATRYLMEAYYHNLLAKGMGRSEALRQVQFAWLKSGSQYASPAYWAAFVVSGNDAPLDAGPYSTVPRVGRSPRGCACDASSPDLGQGAGMALMLGLVLFMIRRRHARSA